MKKYKIYLGWMLSLNWVIVDAKNKKEAIKKAIEIATKIKPEFDPKQWYIRGFEIIK